MYFCEWTSLCVEVSAHVHVEVSGQSWVGFSVLSILWRFVWKQTLTVAWGNPAAGMSLMDPTPISSVWGYRAPPRAALFPLVGSGTWTKVLKHGVRALYQLRRLLCPGVKYIQLTISFMFPSSWNPLRKHWEESELHKGVFTANVHCRPRTPPRRRDNRNRHIDIG